MELVLFRILAIVGIFICGATGVFLPVCFRGNPLFLKLGNFFSAGVLLSGGFVHMLSEAREDMEKGAPAFLENVSYPFPFFYSGLGFCIIYTIDAMAHQCMENRNRGKFPKYDRLPKDDPTKESLNPPPNHSVHSKEDVRGDGSLYTNSPFIAIMLLIVLGVHSVLAGLTLGVTDEVKDGVAVLLVIVSHKMFAAFALGGRMLDAGLWASEGKRLIFYAMTGVFCLCTPVGIAVGMELDGSSDSYVEGILKAFAGGSFVYVATMEILSKEMKASHTPVLDSMIFFTGFSLMSLLAIWI